MRRILIGGLGIAIGAFAPPVTAQQAPGAAAARLGRPVATPPAAAAPLVARGQIPTPYNPGPVTGAYQVVPSVPLTMPSPQGPAPTAKVVIGAPTVTLSRDTGGVESPAAVPPPGIVGGVPLAGPLTVIPPGTTMIPPVGPCDLPGGCPQPSLDAPSVGPDSAGLPPRFPGLTRLTGCSTGRGWVGGEYLAWWTRSTQLPVLVATGPVPAGPTDPVVTPTPVLAGSFGQTLHGGARFSGGWWFSDEERRGIDARVMFLFRNGTAFNANTNEFPVLGRPFTNINDPVGPLTDVIGAPGRSTGSIAVHLENSLWGGEANYRRFLAGNGCARLDGLVGYRFLNFTETLTVTETGILDPASPLVAAGRAPFASATDRFRTENNFHGGQFGLTGEVRRGRWFASGRGTIAFGTVLQSADISGGQVQGFANGAVGLYQGGLLALPGANIGHFSQSRFAVLPEVGLNLGYHVTPNLRVFVGYNFLYLSSVLRPASVVDPVVDAARVPNFLPNPPAVLAGTPRPSPQLHTTDFWTQGLNVGLQWSF